MLIRSLLLRKAFAPNWFAGGLALCSALVVLDGCSPDDARDPSAQDKDAVDEAHMLDRPMGSRSLRQLGFSHVALGEAGQPIHLSADHATSLLVRSPTDAVALMRGTLAAWFQLSADTGFQILADQKEPEQRVIRLRQSYRGVPVAGAEIVVSINSDGQVQALLGWLAPRLVLSVTPGLLGADALSRGLHALGARPDRQPLIHEAPTLTIFVDRQGKTAPVLAYRALVEYTATTGDKLEEVFFDASSGALLARYSQIYDALSRSIYKMNAGAECIPPNTNLPGTLLFNEGGTSSDSAAMGAYTNTGISYWYYKHFHGRDSYDGAGAPLKSSVHAKFGSFCTPNNANWVGSPYNQMAYGDGDGNRFFSLSQSIDVTAHELTHAVTSRTSGLAYQGESGALNEAMSDIFGNAAETWSGSGGGAMGNPFSFVPTDNTWKVAEGVAGPGLPGGALRFMNNPTLDGVSRDYYPDRYTGSQDAGGVHWNSGIANLAFYLTSQSGTHPQGRTSNFVYGMTLPWALRVFYAANSSLLSSAATFQDARNATAQAASNLFGYCSPQWRSIQSAWNAVGVPGAPPLGSCLVLDAQNEVEPNNWPQMNAITKTTVYGTLSSNSDMDSFSFTVPPLSRTSVTLTPPPGANYDLFLVDANGVVLKVSAEGVGMLDYVSGSAIVAPTTYHVIVFSENGVIPDKSYSLYVRNSVLINFP